jgi:hypothetical protein
MYICFVGWEYLLLCNSHTTLRNTHLIYSLRKNAMVNYVIFVKINKIFMFFESVSDNRKVANIISVFSCNLTWPWFSILYLVHLTINENVSAVIHEQLTPYSIVVSGLKLGLRAGAGAYRRNLNLLSRNRNASVSSVPFLFPTRVNSLSQPPTNISS